MQSLTYSITGHIREQESGLGVANLLVRAYDKDLLFDDLLGTSLTDADGQFSLRYSEGDFNELLDRRPDIYLVVYAPPQQLLLTTEKAVRWNATTHEVIDLTIPRAQLGALSPVHPADRVQARLGLLPDALTIEHRGGFAVPKLTGFQLGGLPGTAALPHQTRRVALPLGGQVVSINVMPGEPVEIEGTFNALPAQEPIPDRGLDPRTGQPLSITVSFKPLDLRLTGQLARDPQAMVQLTRTWTMGPVQWVALDVCPVQYDPASRSYRYYPDLSYEVIFDRDAADRVTDQRRRTDKPMGEWMLESLESLLADPEVVIGPGIFWSLPPVLEETPHLIITDNFEWPSSIAKPDGSTRPPTLNDRGIALAGDLVAEFGRLADWRTQRGMRSRVVSITDIVTGVHGDCTQNGFAVDLAEVIRNFLKKAVADWGTSYVVLGGDLNVVPMRNLTGPMTGDDNSIAPGSENPPAEKTSYHAPGTSVSKLFAGFTPNPTQLPVCYHTGQYVRYDRQATADNPGWYYTTEDDFNQLDSGFTRLPDDQPTPYLILEAPDKTLTNEHYYWVFDHNTIPSDFYYASLTGNHYNVPGKHDFDQIGNGLYGQYHHDGLKEVSLDGVNQAADIWVGRVPAESGADVRAYVDKLITYEDLKVPGTGTPVDPAYLKKILYAADHWSAQGQTRQDDLTQPPAENTFTHKEWAMATYLNLGFDVSLDNDVPWWTLYSLTGAVRTELTYKKPSGVAYWVFMTDDTYATPSDEPTRFVMVVGNGTSNDADQFLWLPTAIDLGMAEKETLRKLMKEQYPGFTDISRHYADFYTLAPPPPLVKLEQQPLKQALNEGPHFVSLTGHGWWGGCCTLDVNSQPDFANNRRYFIAFADSCSTARPDGVDSLGEKSVLDPDGGAVAYVGNTRYSWIGVGAGYEQGFWELLNPGSNPDKGGPEPVAAGLWVGMAAGTRYSTGTPVFWTDYAQTLYGDPALQPWVNMPGTKPSYQARLDPGKLGEYATISVVHPGDPVMTRVRPGDPVQNARVTLTTEDGRFLVTGKTNAFGQVRLTLQDYTEQAGPLRLTIQSRSGQFVSELINADKP